MRPPVIAAFAALLLFGVLFGVLFVGQDGELPDPGTDASGRGGGTEREIAGGRRVPPPVPPEGSGAEAPGGDERGTPSGPGDDEPAGDEDPPADVELIPLPRGDAELRLRVVDRSGIPHPDVLVSMRAGRGLESVATDREGLVIFGALAAGNYTFRLESDEIPELTAVKELSVDAGEIKEVVIKIGRFDQKIRGRVLDRSGQPVAGMPVFARKQVFEVDEGDYVVADVSNLETESGLDGYYELVRLEEADYLVRTEATGEYPAAQKVFRAGIQNADLVLEATDDLEVYGTVRSSTGEIVEGAVVSVVGQALRQAVTDARGNFTLPVALSEDRSAYVVRARKDGYQDGQANLLRAEFEGFDRWQVRLVLEPLGLTVPVRGILLDDLGNPVARESVMLYSSALSARHKSISDESGRFDLGEVEVGSYRLWVYPRQRYEDYSLDPVEVTSEGLEIEIVLKSIATGSLLGTMVNPEGNPVAGFTLWLRSMSALGNSVTVTGDSLGRFEAEDVPFGELLFETRSFPRLSVRGLSLDEGDVADVRIVLDWGEGQFSGQVVDEANAPVAGARVTLSWQHREGKLQSSSIRHAVSDESGTFSFSELAPGDHKLSVSHARYKPATDSYIVGSRAPGPVIVLRAK